MGWFEGMMTGFQKRHYDIERENIRQAQLQNERESNIFTALLNSPDLETRQYAQAGLLQAGEGPKRKGGFRGWLTEMESNPYLAKIRALSPNVTTVTPGLRSRQMQGYLSEPPGASAAAAALPASSPTEAGAPGLQMPKPWVNPGPWAGGLGETEPWVPESLRQPDGFGTPPPRPSVLAEITPNPTSLPGGERRPPAERPQPFMGPHRGLLEPGNIDLGAQPKVPNPEGGTSTVYSSGHNVEGEEVLLPAVTPDGRLLSTPEEIVDEYRRTGRHLGKFSDPEASTAYAEKLHNDYEAGVYEPDEQVGTPPPEPEVTVGGTEEEPEVRFTAPEETVVGTAGTAGLLPASPLGTRPPAPSRFITREVPGPEVGRTDVTPRQIFQTKAGQIWEDTLAREGAQHAADYQYLRGLGLSDDEIKAMEQERARRARGSAAGQSYAEGNIIEDPSSPTGWSQQLYLRADPRVTTTIPAQPPGTVKMGNALEEAAAILFPGMNAAQVRQLHPEAFKQVSDLATKIANERAAGRTTATVEARTAAEAKAPLSKEKKFEGEQQLAKEWLDISGNARETGIAVTKMETAMAAIKRDPKNLGPAAEAIILAWQRSNDPNSVVREAEARRPAEFIGLRERIYGAWLQLNQGGAVMSPELLQRYVSLAQEIKRAMDVGLEGHKQRIVNTAMEYEFNPANILPGYKPPAAPRTRPAAPPQGRPNTGVTLDTPLPGGQMIDDQGNWVNP